jgi:prevent-host-death family protein
MKECKKITVGEFRQDLPEYANLAKYKGERFIITRNGKNVGAFISVDDLERFLQLDREKAEELIKENSGEIDCLADVMSSGL